MKIKLGETIQDQDCTIEYFLHPEGGERGIVIVFPGGGYANLAAHEADPIAQKYVELGFHAAVCRYRVSPVTFPVPLQDACNAVGYTRAHAAELNVKADKIAVLGFSAGGHLAAMVSNIPLSEAARPNASILCYPVLSSYAHIGSYHKLFGNDLPPEEYKDFIWPLVANEKTPPAFLWHTINDNGVNSECSLEYTLKLKKLGIPVELHIYPNGPHGLGMCNRPQFEGKYKAVETWPALSATFLKDMGW